jgi:hypothetical protein
VKNENSKLEEQEYGKKTETVENETHSMTWNMARNTEKGGK